MYMAQCACAVVVQCIAIFAVDFISFDFSARATRFNSTRLDSTRHNTTQHDSRSIRIQLVSRQDCISISNIFFLVVYDFYICEVVGPLPLCRLTKNCTYILCKQFRFDYISLNIYSIQYICETFAPAVFHSFAAIIHLAARARCTGSIAESPSTPCLCWWDFIDFAKRVFLCHFAIN